MPTYKVYIGRVVNSGVYQYSGTIIAATPAAALEAGYEKWVAENPNPAPPPLAQCSSLVRLSNEAAAADVVNLRRNFIQNLELPDYEPRLRRFLLVDQPDQPPANDGEKGADVVDGSLVCFVQGLTAQQQSDVLNSCLIAQLNSNKLFDRENDTIHWYNNYANVMGKLGWVIQQFKFEHVDIQSQGLTLNSLALEVISKIASVAGLEVVNEAINKMAGLASTAPPMQMFGSSGSSDTGGSFQISVCENTGGQVTMPLMASYFHSEQHSTNYFFATYSSSNTEVYKSGQHLVLDEDVYGQVRSAVITKLGDMAKKFVIDLQI